MTVLAGFLPSSATAVSACLVLLLLGAAWIIIRGVSPETLLAMYRLYAQGSVCSTWTLCHQLPSMTHWNTGPTVAREMPVV